MNSAETYEKIEFRHYFLLTCVSAVTVLSFLLLGLNRNIVVFMEDLPCAEVVTMTTEQELKTLNEKKKRGIISDEEYKNQRAEIIQNL